MNTFKAILYKEIVELKSDYKKLIVFFPFLILPIIIFTVNGEPLIPMTEIGMLNFTFYITTMAITSQLSVNLFIKEKKVGTLEFILKSKIDKYFFILSKIIIPIAIGLLFVFISLFIFFISVKLNIVIDFSYKISFEFLICCMLLSILSAEISFISAIIIKDERMIPWLSLLIMFLIVSIFAFIVLKLNLYSLVFNISYWIFFTIILFLILTFLLSNRKLVFYN